MGKDHYSLLMPSGGRLLLEVETPLTVEDRAWLHKLVDLILCVDQNPVPKRPLPNVYQLEG